MLRNFLISCATRYNAFNLVNITASSLEQAIKTVEQWPEATNVNPG